MAIVRAAREEDIPRVLELYQQLAITTTEAERQRCLSLDDYRRVFREISNFPGCELLVAEDQEPRTRNEELGTSFHRFLEGFQPRLHHHRLCPGRCNGLHGRSDVLETTPRG